jgi:cysteine-S-conjugate beta-lyase
MTQAVSALDSVTLEELQARRSYKWRLYPADVLPAFVAEMDYVVAPAIRDAIVDAAQRGDTGYASPLAELDDAVSAFARSRFNWEVDPRDVRLLPDVMSGVIELLRVALRPGDGVVINTPVYPPFFSHIADAGCRVVEAPLARSGDAYELDFDALTRAFEGGARVYLLCNPHNPTGNVFARAELERVAALAERHDVLVFADEIHAPLVLAGHTHTPFLSVGEIAAARAVSFVSASKAWNIPGLKCAQAVVASDRTRALAEPLRGLDFISRIGNVGVLATIAAYRESVAWLDDLVAALDRNRVLLRDLLSEMVPGVRYTPPDATYLAWVDCSALHLDTEPADVFRERGRVALGRGSEFGAPGKGFVRITFATTPTILREIVSRMNSALR